MNKETEKIDLILSNLKHIDRKIPNPNILNRINAQLDASGGAVIPLRRIKKLLVAASVLFMVNTIAIVSSLNSQSTEDYVVIEKSNNIISDYKLYD